MALADGTRLGPYEIVAPIGAGGMGEVYRAKDTKLNRDVAIKVLPDLFARDAERLARFTREAQTLASLNHPNIAHIHGLEESAGMRALVMELVAGDDLSALIARGPIPLADALPIAKQIAEALEAAHDLGIVHRDLKPANIKVRDDGTVKVLDFGLAKAMDSAGTSGMDAANSPTLTAHATQMGLLIGTAAYMSPEQARGKTVDKRADIWAFGVVLYEMLTGSRAFAGEEISDVLAAVLRQDVEWRALPSRTPPRLRRLLERCLERDVKQRLRDIGEARVELSALAAGADAGVAPVPVTVNPGWPSRLRWIAAGVVVGTVVTALAVWASRAPASSPAGLERARFRLTLPPTVEVTTHGGGKVSVSPDGRSIAFVALMGGKAQLWLRPLDADDAKPLAGTDGAQLPFWSPDSAFIGFFAGTKLKRIEIRTGTVQSIGDVTRGNGGGASWNRDDVILFSPLLEGPLFRVPAGGGTPVQVTTLDPTNRESNHMWPYFLPDGRHFLFQIFGLSNAGLYVGTIDGPERILVVRQESLDLTAVQYAPPGQIVYVRNHQLVAQPFDVVTFKVTGPPVPLAEGFGVGGPGRPAFGVSGNGILVFQDEGQEGTTQPTWFGRDGSRQGTLGTPGSYGSLDLSPDGQTLAMDRFSEKEVSIWLTDVARGTATRFTSDPYSNGPLWFPRGDRILFGSVRDTPPNPFVRTLAGAETRLARLPSAVDITSVAPDGGTLVGEIGDAKTGSDLWLFAAAADKPPAVFLQTPFNESLARISPNGQWVTFVSDESGQAEVYITTFPSAGRHVRVSADGGSWPRWRDDGAEVFFTSAGKLMAATVAADPAAASTGVQIGTPRVLFELPKSAGAWLPTRGGQRFLVNVEITKSIPSPITVVVNWHAPAGRQ